MITAILTFMGGPLVGFIKAFWRPLAIIFSVLVVVGFIHHKGYSSGVAKTEKKYTVIVAKANAERDSAKAALVRTEAAFALLKKEDERIRAQQVEAEKKAALNDKATAAKIAQIRGEVAKGKTEIEQLRSLMGLPQ